MYSSLFYVYALPNPVHSNNGVFFFFLNTGNTIDQQQRTYTSVHWSTSVSFATSALRQDMLPAHKHINLKGEFWILSASLA